MEIAKTMGDGFFHEIFLTICLQFEELFQHLDSFEVKCSLTKHPNQCRVIFIKYISGKLLYFHKFYAYVKFELWPSH